MERLISKARLSSLVVAGALLAPIVHAEPADSSSDTDAAPEKDDSAATGAASDAAPKASSEKKSDDRNREEMVAEAQAGDSAVELPGKTYYFVGVRYRGIVVPKFMENLFASGGRTVYVNGIGPEFAIRKDGFEYNLSAWLAFYSMGDTAFKGKNDPQTAWELVNSKLDLLYLTSDFLWSHEFTPEFALNYGLGAGLGFVFGNLTRTQSYPTATGQSPNNYSKCAGPFDPDPTYCDNTGHYGSSEPSWANGGSKPIVFPWLTLQTGFRFKVAKEFAGRVDLGFGTSGFFFGFGGDYGL